MFGLVELLAFLGVLGLLQWLGFFTMIRLKVIDWFARNLREPKGIGGHFIRMILENSSNASLENEIVDHLNLQPDHKVLEVGFGPGVGLNAALKKLQHGSGKVYGIDISEQMVEHAKKQFKNEIERQKVEIHLGSVMELPYTDNLFDSVFHTNCYYFWPSLDQGISELKRVMKPGGLMLTGLVHDLLKIKNSQGLLKYGPNWRPEQYLEKLKEGGFINVTMETVTESSGRMYQVIFASKAL